MFKNLSRGMNDIKEIQVKLQEMKISVSEMKNTLNGINGRLDILEENISKLKMQQQKLCKNGKKNEKFKQSIDKLCDNFKQPNIHLIGVPKEGEGVRRNK